MNAILSLGSDHLQWPIEINNDHISIKEEHFFDLFRRGNGFWTLPLTDGRQGPIKLNGVTDQLQITSRSRTLSFPVSLENSIITFSQRVLQELWKTINTFGYGGKITILEKKDVCSS